MVLSRAAAPPESKSRASDEARLVLLEARIAPGRSRYLINWIPMGVWPGTIVPPGTIGPDVT